jgi:hypothetical protein
MVLFSRAALSVFSGKICGVAGGNCALGLTGAPAGAAFTVILPRDKLILKAGAGGLSPW